MAYSNKNFGGSFIFWDKLFGTFCPALPTTPFSYGVSGDRPSANPFWASNLPFLRYFRLARRPAPGRPRDRRSALSVFSGAMLLFSLVVGYVYQYGYGYGDISWPQMALLVLLALGSVALGGMTEGRPWASAVWLLIALGMPLLFIGYLGWPQRYWHIAMAAVALHALCVALGWGEWPHRPPWRNRMAESLPPLRFPTDGEQAFHRDLKRAAHACPAGDHRYADTARLAKAALLLALCVGFYALSLMQHQPRRFSSAISCSWPWACCSTSTSITMLRITPSCARHGPIARWGGW